MDKRIILTILTILLFLGLAITLVMLRRFVPYQEESILYEFDALEINENLSIQDLRNQEVKVLIEFSNDIDNEHFYSVYFYDYDVIMELFEDLLEIKSILNLINYGRVIGLLVTENDDDLTLTFNALPNGKSIYKEYIVNVSKNFLYIIPYTGGMILQLDFSIQIFSMLGTFGVLNESIDYYSEPVSLKMYTSGNEETSRIFLTVLGNDYYTRSSFCEFCNNESIYNGVEVSDSKVYIIK
ncbi:MAG: hypothetical protein NUK62_02890 [Tenericutes bacterium]|jgi:hypothetical protein|nr:hypothetical protein [Mycoplasmatota bacterium]